MASAISRYFDRVELSFWEKDGSLHRFSVTMVMHICLLIRRLDLFHRFDVICARCALCSELDHHKVVMVGGMSEDEPWQYPTPLCLHALLVPRQFVATPKLWLMPRVMPTMTTAP